MRMIKMVRTLARWIERTLAVRLPMDALYGLRTR
jgi:hypothetical protein